MARGPSFLLIPIAVVLAFAVAPPAPADAATTCQKVTDGFGNGHSQAGTDFFVKNLTLRYGSGPVKLARNCAGTTPLNVDDGITVEVTRPGGSTSSFSHDFSAGCSGTITDAGPFDLTSRFAPGNNAVKVRFQDICGAAGSGTSDVFLVSEGCADVRVGQAVAQGCFREAPAGSGVFETDQKAWVGGFEIQPRPGGFLSLNTRTPAVSAEGAGVDVIFAGVKVPIPMSALPVGTASATVDLGLPGTATSVNVLDLPLRGTAKVSWTGGGRSATFEGELVLESLLQDARLVSLAQQVGAGQAGGKLTARLTNGQGFVVDLAEVSIAELNFIPGRLRVPKIVSLRNLLLRFERRCSLAVAQAGCPAADQKPFWTGRAGIRLPLTRGNLDVTGTAFLFEGALAGLGMEVDGLNRPLGATPLFLQKVSGAAITAPRFGYDIGLGGTFGPSVNGAAVMRLDGNVQGGALSRGCSPAGFDPMKMFALMKLVPLTEAERNGVARVEMTTQACFYTGDRPAVDAVVAGKISFAQGLLGYEGSQSGSVSPNGLNLEGSVLLRLPALPDLRGTALISTRGVAACTSAFVFFDAGFGFRWGQSPSTFSGCDLTEFRVLAVAASPRARAAATVRVPRVFPTWRSPRAPPAGRRA